LAGQHREKKSSWLGEQKLDLKTRCPGGTESLSDSVGGTRAEIRPRIRAGIKAQNPLLLASVDSLLWSFLISVSRALDLSYTGVMSHHMRVAVITAKISRVLGLSQERITQASQAALIHDLGVKTWGDRARLHQFEVDDPYQHALDGCLILTCAGPHEAPRGAKRTEGQVSTEGKGNVEGHRSAGSEGSMEGHRSTEGKGNVEGHRSTESKGSAEGDEGTERGKGMNAGESTKGDEILNSVRTDKSTECMVGGHVVEGHVVEGHVVGGHVVGGHVVGGYLIGARMIPECMVGGQTLFFPHAAIILHHHDRWEGGNPTQVKQDAIPVESRIIHLADRMDVLLDERRPFNSQKEKILGALEGQRARAFDPELIDIINDLAKSESFWFDLERSFLPKSLEVCVVEGLSQPMMVGASQAGQDSLRAVNRSESPIAEWDNAPAPSFLQAGRARSGGSAPSFLDTLEVLAWVFAEVVDRRSPYTYRHSRSVGKCAFLMGKYLGLDQFTCRELRVAGLLHDLGKMGVSEDILDKKGSLTEEEICIVKRHPYLTYQLLDDIPGFGQIKKWASFHHERMDGQGYPFRLDSSALSLEARIIAVCDVFSALSEDRPYRPGLSREEVQRILTKMAENGALDKEIVDLAGKVLWGVSDLVAATDTQVPISGGAGVS